MKALRNIRSGLPGAALALCLCITLLALLLYVCGTCAPLMAYMFRTHAPTAMTYLPEEHYEPMARMFTGYLLGTVEEFQYTLSSGELQYRVFHSYEQQHMQDCRALFELCRSVLLAGTAFSVALLRLVKADRSAMRGMCAASGGILVLLAALGVAAAVDFDGLFILFHQLSFSNELWMLNPQTDMLIRLMPLELFIHYVCIIGAVWGSFMLLLLGISWRLGFGE